MAPYLPNIPRRVAHLLAMLMVRDEPDNPHEPFKFESNELDIGDDEVVIVTYTRKRKPSQSQTRIQQMYVTTPVLEYAGEGVA